MVVMNHFPSIILGYIPKMSMDLHLRLGMVRTREGTLRYTINGEDQGLACENIPPNVHAVVDLYGQCAQVSIVHAAPLSHPSARGALAVAQHTAAVASATAENSQVSTEWPTEKWIKSKEKTTF